MPVRFLKNLTIQKIHVKPNADTIGRPDAILNRYTMRHMF